MGSSPPRSAGPGSNPVSGWVNLVLLGSPPPSYVGSSYAGALITSANMDIQALTEHAQDIFGLYNAKLELLQMHRRRRKLIVSSLETQCMLQDGMIKVKV